MNMSLCGANSKERDFKRKIVSLEFSIKNSKKKDIIENNKKILEKTLQDLENYRMIMKSGFKKKGRKSKKYIIIKDWKEMADKK
jgi:uncharacterized tellurite resistance protein B-like protein